MIQILMMKIWFKKCLFSFFVVAADHDIFPYTNTECKLLLNTVELFYYTFRVYFLLHFFFRMKLLLCWWCRYQNWKCVFNFNFERVTVKYSMLSSRGTNYSLIKLMQNASPMLLRCSQCYVTTMSQLTQASRELDAKQGSATSTCTRNGHAAITKARTTYPHVEFINDRALSKGTYWIAVTGAATVEQWSIEPRITIHHIATPSELKKIGNSRLFPTICELRHVIWMQVL